MIEISITEFYRITFPPGPCMVLRHELSQRIAGCFMIRMVSRIPLGVVIRGIDPGMGLAEGSLLDLHQLPEGQDKIIPSTISGGMIDRGKGIDLAGTQPGK